MLRCVVFGGVRGPRRVYEPPGTAIHDAAQSEPWPHQDRRTGLSSMLDPSEDFFSYALLDDATVHKTGRRTTVAGGEAIEVMVSTVSWGLPDIFQGYHAASMEGTADHVLLLAGEIGTILRVAARLDGRKFRIAEVADISYDQRCPEDTFRLELPGVEFR
jgi:hypothetical protein